MKRTDLSGHQAALALAIEVLERQTMTPKNEPQNDVARGEALQTLRRMLATAEVEDPAEAGPQEGVAEHAEPDPLQLWGHALRERREALSMTRPQLAKLAGFTEGTLKALETGRRAPSRQQLANLFSVAELKLDPTDPLLRNPLGEDPDPMPNCWLAPGFDSIKMVKELALSLNGRGGFVEQSGLYIDHMSAANWCSIADQEDYVAAQAGKPLDRCAAQLMRSVNEDGVDLIALGCGDGKNEVRLVQHMLERVEHADLRLYLLDISQPLLSSAYKHAADTLADRRGVAMFAIQGNFHDLPRYTQLLYTPQRAHRRRVVCMFGYTFGNLQNEPLFVRNSLASFAPGDMLLLDVGLVCAPVDRPEEIKAKDPRLSGKLASGWQQRYNEWLAGPIKRYAKDVTQVEFGYRLDTTSCPVPGSYAVEVVAKVKSTNDVEKEFSIFQVRRYDALKLIDCMKKLGWDPVDGWPYGNDPRLLYLFRKRA